MRLSVRQEIITLFWPTLEKPQLDHCGSIRENRDKLVRLKHSSQNDERTQNCDLQAKAEEQGIVFSNRGKFEGLKLAALLCVKSSMLSYCPVKYEKDKISFATRKMWVGYWVPVQKKYPLTSDRLGMLNPMSLLIMLNAIPRELSCWDYASLDPYLSPHRAQHPQQMELVLDSWEGPRVTICHDLHWVWVWSCALPKAKLTCGFT